MTPLFHAQPAWKDLLGNLKASEYQCVLPVPIVHSAVVQEFPLTLSRSLTAVISVDCWVLYRVVVLLVQIYFPYRTELLESVPVMCLSKHHLAHVLLFSPGFGSLLTSPPKSVTKSIIRTMEMNGSLDSYSVKAAETPKTKSIELEDGEDDNEEEEEEKDEEEVKKGKKMLFCCGSALL